MAAYSRQLAPPRLTPSAASQVAEKVKEMKGEADKLFLGKEFTKAIEAYDKAIKVVPSGAAEAADLHTNKAACFYQLKK